MRTLLLTTCAMLLFSLRAMAQSPGSGDCRTAIPVCADAPLLYTADGRGAVDDFDPEVIRSTGCLELGGLGNGNVEQNTSWFVFRAGTGGQVGFDIEALPVPGSNTITAEWDFAVYGPDVDCGGISNGTAQPIRCNYEATQSTFTGLGVNPETGQAGAPSLTNNQNTYDEYLDVQPGEIYYILINNYNTNFDNEAETFMLTFTGSSVQADQNTALDCTLRDEFLGLDIVACEGDPDILLSALNSPVGPDIDEVIWTVDYEDDGVVDDTLTGIGAFGAELIVSSPNTGRYFARIETASGTPPFVEDQGGILINFFGPPEFLGAELLETNLSVDPDQNDVEIVINGTSTYEYALNGGEFQDDPIFQDVPPGLNTVIINDKNGCGTTEEEFLVVGYPKFFTPNGDGINDTWNILGIETLNNPVTFIFDRYGKLLKQLDANSTWDGTYNGSRMPSTDYWFRFEYGRAEDDVVVARTRKTHFSLVR